MMSNKEAVDLVAATPDCMAATQLVNVAASRWKQFRPNSKQDDLSAVVLYLHRDVVSVKGGDEVGCVGSLSDSFEASDDDAQSGVSRPDAVFNDEGQRLESRPDTDEAESALDDARCHANNKYRSMLQNTLCDDMQFAVEV